MKRLSLLLLLTMGLLVNGRAQSNFFKSKNAYLGQKPPTDTPQIFAERMLVPDSGIAMDRSAFSADGKEFYYLNAQTWFDARKSRIRYFKFDGKQWQGPTTLLQGYYMPTFTMDGQSMIVVGGPGDGKHSIVKIIHRTADGW